MLMEFIMISIAFAGGLVVGAAIMRVAWWHAESLVRSPDPQTPEVYEGRTREFDAVHARLEER